MKSKIRKSVLLLVLILFPVIFPKQVSAQTPYVSYQVFYDQLSPYGQWVDYPAYGYVWLPNAGSDFYPYQSGGRWIMTEYGWTWLSDYDWGWAPFHYGRWDYDNFYGWYWVPDNIWGPAWVIWRRAPGYYGWAPMGPGMNYGLNYSSYYNNYGNRWIFVNDRYFGRNNNNRRYASRDDYDMLLGKSTVINNTYVDNSRNITYISGPASSDVQGFTGRRVSSYAIQENNVPGQSLSNGQLRIYKPQVTKNNENAKRSAPTVITNREDVRQQGERNTYNNTRPEQQQDAINRQNTMNQQSALDKQNAIDRQNTVNQQNAVDRQNATDQQTAVKRQNEVDKQNAVNRQSAADRQNTVNRQNAADQQDAVNQQKAVNRQNATDRQNAVKRQNDVNKQNVRNNEKVLQQQNERKTINERREQSSNTVNTSRNAATDESGKNSPRRK